MRITRGAEEQGYLIRNNDRSGKPPGFVPGSNPVHHLPPFFWKRSSVGRAMGILSFIAACSQDKNTNVFLSWDAVDESYLGKPKVSGSNPLASRGIPRIPRNLPGSKECCRYQLLSRLLVNRLPYKQVLPVQIRPNPLKLRFFGKTDTATCLLYRLFLSSAALKL